MVGVVGPLQFEVLASRIGAEYGLAAHFESAGLEAARWIETDELGRGGTDVTKAISEDREDRVT